MKRFSTVILACVVVLVLTVLLTAGPAFAEEALPTNAKSEVFDAWEEILKLESERVLSQDEHAADEKAYCELLDEVYDCVLRSGGYQPGTLRREADSVLWTDLNGDPNGYIPEMRAGLFREQKAVEQYLQEQKTENKDTQVNQSVSQASFSASSSDINVTTSTNVPGSHDTALFVPFPSELSEQYPGWAFFNSDHLSGVLKDVAAYTGGKSYIYEGSKANVTNMGKALSNCGVVAFSSHGIIWNGVSYLTLHSGTGLTDVDKSCGHAIRASGSYNGKTYLYWCIDGTVLANHMTGTAPNNLVFFGCCNGMTKDSLWRPLRNKGVAAVVGFTGSVYLHYEEGCTKDVCEALCAGKTLAQGMSAFKEDYGSSCWNDREYCYPIVVSAQDSWVTGSQTVRSTWKLPVPLSVKLGGIGDIVRLGNDPTITGTIQSQYTINTVGVTLEKDGKELWGAAFMPMATSVALKTSIVNTYDFSQLAVGNYQLIFKVKDQKGRQLTYTHAFSVLNKNTKNLSVYYDKVDVVGYHKPYQLQGTIETVRRLRSVSIYISENNNRYTSISQWEMPDEEIARGIRTFDLNNSKLTSALKISSLPEGTYYLGIYATDGNLVDYGYRTSWEDVKSINNEYVFTVQKASNLANTGTIKITPVSAAKANCSLSGKVSSNYELTSVSCKLLKGDTVCSDQTLELPANVRKLTLANEDFGIPATLKNGSYTLVMIAKDNSGKALTKEYAFEVKGFSTLSITLTNPGNVPVGGMTANYSGLIKSNYYLQKIWTEILASDKTLINKKQTTPKSYYTELNLSNSTHGNFVKEQINQLSPGTYYIRVTAWDAGGNSVTELVKFKVASP